MKSMIRPLILALFLCFAAAWAADFAGTFKASIPAKKGDPTELTFKLKAEGEKLTGAVVNARGREAAIEDGKVAGDTITFTVKQGGRKQTVATKYEGKVSGDEIKFTSTREGARRGRDFTAKRVN